MRLLNLLDRGKRARGLSIVRKAVGRAFKRPVPSVPVFVFGKQRSGTTMMMDVFHARRDTEVFDERAASRAFVDYRIRGFDVVARLVERSKAPFVCFKPLADSHQSHEFAIRFPEARLLWIYRDYVDSALSGMKKWPDGRRAIRLVSTGQSGGGWFQEGVSKETTEVLRRVYSADLTELDLACLVWWARNRLILELELMSLPSLLIVRYEDLIRKPREAFEEVFEFIGMSYYEAAVSGVVRNNNGSRKREGLSPSVERLCDDLLSRLDEHVRFRRREPQTLGAGRRGVPL